VQLLARYRAYIESGSGGDFDAFAVLEEIKKQKKERSNGKAG
jgi:hypothetical protein